ncbi:MAG TPA: Na+/H+ antiporter NhaA [Cyclobacteriaceae bacterium]|nr:Na+/H+ antiporter NhaA [Cyclobacteriaceae bacterium]
MKVKNRAELLASAIPLRSGDAGSPSTRLQHSLDAPVTFVILPIFALANTAISLSGSYLHNLSTLNSIGIILGLLVGKPLGIIAFIIAGLWWVGVLFPVICGLLTCWVSGFWPALGLPCRYSFR